MPDAKGAARRVEFDRLVDGLQPEPGDDHSDRLRTDPGYLEFELDQAVSGLLRLGRPVAEDVINGVLKRHGFEVPHG